MVNQTYWLGSELRLYTVFVVISQIYYRTKLVTDYSKDLIQAIISASAFGSDGMGPDWSDP